MCKFYITDKVCRVGYFNVEICRAAMPNVVSEELDKLMNDITILKVRKMSVSEVFYYASMIHLVFVHIHPFADGNGRAARLLEKWFLSEMLGSSAWAIRSEKLYQNRRAAYYKNLNIGATYENADYDLSIPFLLMLPMSLTAK